MAGLGLGTCGCQAPVPRSCLPSLTALQMTLYVPGPVLREGENEVLLLEVEQAPEQAAGAWRLFPGLFC